MEFNVKLLDNPVVKAIYDGRVNFFDRTEEVQDGHSKVRKIYAIGVTNNGKVVRFPAPDENFFKPIFLKCTPVNRPWEFIVESDEYPEDFPQELREGFPRYKHARLNILVGQYNFLLKNVAEQYRINYAYTLDEISHFKAGKLIQHTNTNNVRKSIGKILELSMEEIHTLLEEYHKRPDHRFGDNLLSACEFVDKMLSDQRYTGIFKDV